MNPHGLRHQNLNLACLPFHHARSPAANTRIRRHPDRRAERGARPILACDRKLVALLQQVPGAFAVVDRDEPLPAYDLWVEQMSLPWLLKTTLETIPSPRGATPASPRAVRPTSTASGPETIKAASRAKGGMAAALGERCVLVRFAGVITTPGVAYLTRTGDFAAGVMISASHNPFEDNGIKVFARTGYKLPDAEEHDIE